MGTKVTCTLLGFKSIDFHLLNAVERTYVVILLYVLVCIVPEQ